MRVLRDFCLVKIDKKYRDEIKTKSGAKLYVAPEWRPEWHATIEGKVVAIPEKLSDQYFENKGIVADVHVGDKIYFNYLVVSSGGVNEVKIDDELYYKVDYPAIWAYKRRGKLTMISGWVFVEPYVEKKDEKVGSLYLPEMSQTEVHKDLGTIYRIGKPLAHEHDLKLKQGDVVAFRKIGAFENEIEGHNVYVMKQECIMAKINM